MYHTIVVGCGLAGSVMARELAERGNEQVLVLEKRGHIGGNCYDCLDENGILIHPYGPHIFHTNSEQVYVYLSRFTEWYDYQHEVVADVYGQKIPVPFNLNTLHMVFEEEMAGQMERKLIETFGKESRVPILHLMEQEDEDLKTIADYVYQNIFLKYTVKQWGYRPEEINPEVTGRVPVVVSRDNRYFQDEYQGMPLRGYTEMVKEILAHPGITVQFHTDAADCLKLESGRIYMKSGEMDDSWQEFSGKVIYTGPLDEFFHCSFGRLPYRSLDFVSEYYAADSYQEKAVINYTVSEEYTRITEFKKLTGQAVPNKTAIMKEYPKPYTDNASQIPYYAVLNEENQALYEKYNRLLKVFPNFYTLGRLAEYRYYNMDAIVGQALTLAKQLLDESSVADR